MRTLAKKATFLGVVAAVVAVTVGSLAFSQDVTFGAETDSSDTDVSVDTGVPDPTNEQFPVVGGSSAIPDQESIPPAAPLDDGNDGSVGANANSLPSAGSGGYLGSSGSNTLAYALMAFAIAIVMTGSIAWVSSRE